MDKYFQDYTVALISELKAISPPSYVPPDDGAKPKTEMVLARSLVSNTRGYIERVVAQINGTYENGWYDGCAVMIRRLLETLIVEVFENYKIATKIQNPNGDFYYLSDLISCTLSETSWNLSRNSRLFPARQDPRIEGAGMVAPDCAQPSMVRVSTGGCKE